MKTKNHKKHTNSKKNETKSGIVSNKDTAKDSKQTSTKKPNSKDKVEKSSSEAGKGDKLRRGITQDEWGKKYEKIDVLIYIES